MKNQLIFSTIIALSLIFTTCANELDDYKITQIKYGTSFGKCIGYCKHELIINSDKSTSYCSGWQENILPKSNNLVLSKTAWDSVRNELDIDAFSKLPKVIGCPDCADGGAEWLEIMLSTGENYNVTFEYQNEPKFLENQIKKLRLISEQNRCN